MQQPHSQRFTRTSLGAFALFVPILLLFFMAYHPSTAIGQTNPTVGFTTASINVNENAGTIEISVQLSETSANEIRVLYETFDGTAKGGTDYINTSGTLILPAGTISDTIPVTIRDNTTYTGNRFFYLELVNPISATLASNHRLQINIVENDSTPVPTSTPGGQIYADAYEPNDNLSTAYTVAANQVGATAQRLCNITLWPVGDVDFFKFWGKSGTAYKAYTTQLAAGLDTYMTLYDTQGNVMGTNDDYQSGSRASQLTFNVGTEGFYYIRIINQDPSDPANKTYCLQVDEVLAPTPTPSSTSIPGDDCEFNSTIETACLLGIGEVKKGTFTPVYGSLQDSDYYRLWVKPGIRYTCETLNLSVYADTNIILHDQNGNPFNPWIGNDDREIGDRSSKVEYWSTYTGYLMILVGPVNPPPYEESSLHTYEIQCTADPATPTPVPTNTPVYVPPTGGTGGTGSTAPTATPFEFPTPFPTPTAIDFSSFATATPFVPPVVQFQPLPTATPVGGGERITSVNVTVYYDANENFMPELNEGVVDVAVALYDNSTGELLAFGYTNEAGAIRFDSIVTSGPVRVYIPLLNYAQVVAGGSSNILIRVAPQPLPANIP